MFNKILLSTSTPEIIANDYLHFVNSHSKSLEKFSITKTFRIVFLTRFLIVMIIRLIKSIFKKKYVLKNHKSDVIFVSHLTNISQKFQENDAYFGNLPTLLKKRNISSSVVLINHIKADVNIFNAEKKTLFTRFILNETSDFLSELKICISQIKNRKKLLKILQKLNIDKNHLANILNHNFSPDTHNAIRIAKQIALITKKTGANFIFTTHEGHAWERLVYYYTRKINPNIKCFGYQHAAISKYNYAINRPLQDYFNPDVILTSGLITQKIFENNKNVKSKIICLGSFKPLPEAKNKDTTNSCLVVPEGILSECKLLFGLSTKYAKKHKNQKFIWRLHPILNFENLKNKICFFNNLPKNIYLSDRTLDTDIRECSSVLYRGSTTVFRAINAGLSPIYFQESIGEFNIDPIFNILDGKFIVKNESDLYFALQQKLSLKQKIRLSDFSKKYFTPVNLKNLIDLF